jgi:hypothetical protein
MEQSMKQSILLKMTGIGQMTKREYLRSLGFRVGERGRFTDEQKTAIAAFGGVFDDDIKPLKLNKLKIDKPVKVPTRLPEQRRQREARQLSGYTKEGYKVGFVMCAACNEHMIWCGCDKVAAPSIVVRSDDSLVKVLTTNYQV